MPEIMDKLMALADGLISALSEEEFSLPFTAEWIDNPVLELADPELRTARVWVVDFAEREETVHGIPLEEYELLLVVQQKLDAKSDPSSECRRLSALVSEIAQYCRSTPLIVDGDAAVCVKIERERSRDFREYHEKLLFRAEVSTHWQKVADGDE